VATRAASRPGATGLRRWWAGAPRTLLLDTGAFLLPARLPLRPADHHLEIGSGAIGGLLAPRVGLRGPPVAVVLPGTRPAPAPRGGARPRLVRAAAPHLPFPDACFTVAVVGHGARRWDDAALQAALAELWRVLTHNGVVVLWEVARSRSPAVNAVWRSVLEPGGGSLHLRSFAQIGRLAREAGFAWIQTFPLQPFLWPPGPRVALLLRKEAYDPRTVGLPPGEPPLAGDTP
jgi:SAM-dependent methyltransferase